jgi:hypothetical protein
MYEEQQLNSRNGRSVTLMLSQANSYTQARLDMYKLEFA